MILERSMNDAFLSNTYLVADRPGGTSVMIDAGGPVEPLLERIVADDLTLSHVLLTHRHHDHVAELGAVRERHPEAVVLAHPLEGIEEATGTLEPGVVVRAGELEIEALHTPGHTAGMLSL